MKKIFLIACLILIANSAQAEQMKTYYPNGKVQMEITDQGMKTYYENGQVSSEMPQKNGSPSGIGKTYYESGKVMSETEYKDGDIVGLTKQFYENGKIMREEDHKTGSWKAYGEDGKLAAEGKS